MRSAWRRRCPVGHTSLESREGSFYFCKSCSASYHGEPLDAKQHDFPVDDVDERRRAETPHKRTVLYELVQQVDNDRGVKAADVDCGSAQVVGRLLSQWRESGHVAKTERSLPSLWRPTDAGRKLVAPLEADA